MKELTKYSPSLTINCHSSTDPNNLGLISVSDFINGYDLMVTVYEMGNGEIMFETIEKDFACGVFVSN